MEKEEILQILEERFKKNMDLHKDISWQDILVKIKDDDKKLSSLIFMEESGGEPDVCTLFDGRLVFVDFSKETPIGRRSLSYDKKARLSRKKNSPKSSAIEMAEENDINILNEKEYRFIQGLKEMDLKTSSWIKTPDDIRNLGGGLFCDRRYNKVFTYHNGAMSYYGSRGFRAYILLWLYYMISEGIIFW